MTKFSYVEIKMIDDLPDDLKFSVTAGNELNKWLIRLTVDTYFEARKLALLLIKKGNSILDKIYEESCR